MLEATAGDSDLRCRDPVHVTYEVTYWPKEAPRAGNYYLMTSWTHVIPIVYGSDPASSSL